MALLRRGGCVTVVGMAASTRVARRLRRAAPVVVATMALALTGCGGEEELRGYGQYSALEAETAERLESAGVTVAATQGPQYASADAVADALRDAGLTGEPAPADEVDGLALDDAAGLVGVVVPAEDSDGSDQPRFVVGVFDEPASAVVFAESEPAVFESTAASDRAQGFYAGNLLGYYVPADGEGAGEQAPTAQDFAAALASLAGPVGSPSGSTSPPG